MSTSLEKRVSAYNSRRSSPRKSTKSKRATSRSPRAQGRKSQASYSGSTKGRGSATRGWYSVAPEHGHERHDLREQCGSKCFLDPRGERFPICERLEEGKGCKVDCRGVHAAYQRARQYHHEDVAEKAANVLKKECGTTPSQRSPRKTTASPRKTASRRSPARR